MNKILILVLITLSSCRFMQFAEGDSKPVTNFNVISVLSENVRRIEKFHDKEGFTSFVKQETKDLEDLKKTWTEKYSDYYAEISKIAVKGTSSVFVFPGLLAVKVGDFLDKKAKSCLFTPDVQKEHDSFVSELKENGTGKFHKFIKVYRDDTVKNIFRAVAIIDYPREDDKHDIVYINSNRQFEIPPVKRLKESAKEKEEKDLVESDYEYYTPEEFSEEQLKTIEDWYAIANKVALSSFLA